MKLNGYQILTETINPKVSSVEQVRNIVRKRLELCKKMVIGRHIDNWFNLPDIQLNFKNKFNIYCFANFEKSRNYNKEEAERDMARGSNPYGAASIQSMAESPYLRAKNGEPLGVWVYLHIVYLKVNDQGIVTGFHKPLIEDRSKQISLSNTIEHR